MRDFQNLHVLSPIFLQPKSLKMAIFGCKKMGLWMPKSKNGDHFLSPTIPKNGGTDSCFTWISFWGEFWANFENRLFLAHFWPISHCKIPKSKTYGAIAQIKSLKSSNGCFELLIHKGTVCEVGRAQKNIFGFSGHPNFHGSLWLQYLIAGRFIPQSTMMLKKCCDWHKVTYSLQTELRDVKSFTQTNLLNKKLWLWLWLSRKSCCFSIPKI